MEDKKLTLAPEVEEPETAEDTNELYIKFAKPYTFGDKTYTGIDLSGLEDVNGAVLKEAGRVVQKLFLLKELQLCLSQLSFPR